MQMPLYSLSIGLSAPKLLNPPKNVFFVTPSRPHPRRFLSVVTIYNFCSFMGHWYPRIELVFGFNVLQR